MERVARRNAQVSCNRIVEGEWWVGVVGGVDWDSMKGWIWYWWYVVGVGSHSVLCIGYFGAVFVVVVVVGYCHLQVATTEEGLEYVGVGGK